VAAGGHDIPEAKIRERYDRSRKNLIRLLPRLSELSLYDNSAQGNLDDDDLPPPLLILRMVEGRITETCNLTEVPVWARSIVIAAVREYLSE
jgi:hypothetical protein